MLLLHPDFLWNTPLAASIRQYEYFDYAVNEALFLAEKEEAVVTDIVRALSAETRGNMDAFTQRIVVARLELLLSYADRFYHRQFLTRKISSHKMLGRLEELLTDYFDNEALLRKGLPTVPFVAESLNVSPNYLSGLLKVLTGQSTLQHIHAKLVEKAKEKLSTSELSVSEIAYELGFEYPQSFSKLFKAKTQVSPGPSGSRLTKRRDRTRLLGTVRARRRGPGAELSSWCCFDLPRRGALCVITITFPLP